MEVWVTDETFLARIAKRMICCCGEDQLAPNGSLYITDVIRVNEANTAEWQRATGLVIAYP